MENFSFQNISGIFLQNRQCKVQKNGPSVVTKYTLHFENGIILVYLYQVTSFPIFGQNTTIGSVFLSKI